MAASADLSSFEARKCAHLRMTTASRPRRSSPLHGTAAWRARDARMDSAGGFAARLGRRLPAARQIHQHAQGLYDRALAHRAASDRAEAALAMQDPAVARVDRAMHDSYPRVPR